MPMHILPRSSFSVGSLDGQRASRQPDVGQAGRTASAASTSQFHARPSEPLRLQENGAIVGAAGQIGSIDQDFNFSLQAGGVTVQGNLLELLVQSLVEGLLAELGSLDLGAAEAGDRFSFDGRGYELQPLDDGSRSPSTTGWPTIGGQGATPPVGSSSGGASWSVGSLSGGGAGMPGPITPGARAGSTPGENATLPIWPPTWDPATRQQFEAILANDPTSIEQKRAALSRFTAFRQELFGGEAQAFNDPEASGFIQNMFGSGAIHDERYYAQALEQKRAVTQAYQQHLGRPPTSHELRNLMYGSPNLSANDSLFAQRMANVTAGGLQAFAQEVARNPNLRDTERGVGDRFSDKQIADGVHEYLRANPNATEAQIRQVAKTQYGLSDAQLDRVKTNYFAAPPPTTPATTSPRAYSDQEVADGVREYLRANPNATEAQSRQVAQSQFGISTSQLDRVKTTHFPAAPPAPTAPAAGASVTPAPMTAVSYTDAQVADGVREYLRNNPGATEAQIRQVAQSQFGIATAQLDRVKQTYFS